MPSTIISTQYIRDQVRLVVDPLLLHLREQIYGSGTSFNTYISPGVIPPSIPSIGDIEGIVEGAGFIKTIRVFENGTSKGNVKELDFHGATVTVTGDQADITITSTTTVKKNNVNVGTAFTAFDFKDSSTPELDWVITDNSPTATIEIDLSPHINKVATTSVLGHVMVGSGLHVTPSGLLTISGATIQATLDIKHNSVFQFEASALNFIDNTYGDWITTLGIDGETAFVEFDISPHAEFEATDTDLGHVIVGDGLTVTDGVVSLNLEVTEIDGVPDVAGVNRIRFPNGSVTNDGGGQVTITISGGSGGTTASGNSTHTGLWGNEPVAISGDLFFPTDAYALERYTGSGWSPFGPLYAFTTPPLTGWTLVNAGTGSYVTTQGVVTVISPASNTSFAPRVIRTMPTAPFTVTAYFTCSQHAGNVNEGYGMVLQQSSDNKSVTFHVNPKDASWNVARWNGDYSFNSIQVFLPHDRFYTQNLWIRVQDTGSLRKWFASMDGVYFIEFYSSSNTEWVTPDRIGFFNYNGSSSFANAATLHSWKVE